MGLRHRPAVPVLAVLTAFTPAALLPPTAYAGGDCDPSGPPASLGEIVNRVEADHLTYVFVGERHGIGPVKRFAVDLANALVDRGADVGLYVEGFRAGCAPRDDSCRSLARLFNPRAFRALLDQSRAAVHPLDPVGMGDRAARMAATLDAGAEAVRVVLVGRSHVVDADRLAGGVWLFAGALAFPSPGDLTARFPRGDYLTVGLETAAGAPPPYSLRRDGCAVDYVVTTAETAEYPVGDPAVPRAQVSAARPAAAADEPRLSSSTPGGASPESSREGEPSSS